MENKTPADESRLEHEAIKAQVHFLSKRFADLSAQMTDMDLNAAQIRELLGAYRLALYDFRDGMERHCRADEKAFKGFNRASAAKMRKEHEKYQAIIENAIREAEGQDENLVTSADLLKFSRDINRLVADTSQPLIEHIDRENRLFAHDGDAR